MLFILLFLFPFFVLGMELNLVCTNIASNTDEVDVKDVFVIINTEQKVVEVGACL